MKLFEFSVTLSRDIVIAAENETAARTFFESMSALGLSAAGDPGEVYSIELTDERDGDEKQAHEVIPAVPPVRGGHIAKTGHHDAGSFACCSYCGRYSDKPNALFKDDYPCDCGKLHGWSGSFKRPTVDSIWSEA